MPDVGEGSHKFIDLTSLLRNKLATVAFQESCYEIWISVEPKNGIKHSPSRPPTGGNQLRWAELNPPDSEGYIIGHAKVLLVQILSVCNGMYK